MCQTSRRFQPFGPLGTLAMDKRIKHTMAKKRHRRSIERGVREMMKIFYLEN